MRPEDLVFWLDVLRSGPTEHGVLCRRHADTMVVPRGWTLDDLRDPDLHLFRPPADDSGSIRRPRTRRSSSSSEHEQLALGVEPEPATSAPPPPAPPPSEPQPAVAADADADAETSIDTAIDTDGETSIDADLDADGDAAEPWMPVFDTSDDLDGLLAARSPLLSRAFRGERND